VLEAARDLYAVPPADFIARRNALREQLQADGHADDAATVARLRRPRLAEWALNRLARADPALVARLATSIAAAQRAQSAAIGGDAGGLRAATADLRDALNTVADAAVRGLAADGGNGEAQRDDLTTILRELVANADPSPLVAGVVGSEAIVASGEFFPGAPDPAPPAPPSTRPTETTSTAAAVRAMARAERLALHEQARAAQATMDAAAAAVEQAQQALAERKRELKAAKAAARTAATDLATFDAAHAD
jgi:hypothetical protein